MASHSLALNAPPMPYDPHAEVRRLEAEMNALIAQTADLERRIETLRSVNPGIGVIDDTKILASEEPPTNKEARHYPNG